VFSSLVAVLSLSIALLFATQADKNLKAAPVYKTLMIWPYAVAPAVAGVLWIFMFSSFARHLARTAALDGIRLESASLNGNHAMTLVVMAAVWKQISYNFLSFWQDCSRSPKASSKPVRSMAPGRCGGSGPSCFRCCRRPLLSAGRQHRLRLLFDTFGIIDAVTGAARRLDHDHGLQGLLPTDGSAATSAVRRAIGGADGDRDRADRDPVPLCRRKVQY